MEFAQPLREEDADPDPVRQFSAWFEQAQEAGVRAPEAAALATATAQGAPAVRMVLVKCAGGGDFRFFTSYLSRKGRELAENPQAALLFHWDALGRQVRLEGPVAPLSSEESAEYIRRRPRGSQLSALASPQSEVVSGRDELERRVADLAAAYADADLPLPADWGGFRLLPARFEFWQHREDRLHDRLLYLPAEAAGWRIQRLGS